MTRPVITTGAPEPLGVSVDTTGINVAVYSGTAEAVAISLFDADDREIARHRLPARTGDVFHGHVRGFGAGTRYGLRAFGAWDPARGHRFNPAKLLADPFATAIDRAFRLHPTLFDAASPDPADTAGVMPKCIVGSAEPIADPSRPLFAWDRQVIYELHVRGFTMRHPEIPASLRGTFAGLAHEAAIAHLVRLGISAVELMPVAAWVDERHLPPLGLTNYWGYNPVAPLAPDQRLAPGGWEEIRAAVDALHAAGIAVIVDIVLNHTGEGDHLGPTLSLRGLDNAGYYRLLPDDPSRYADDTGCGNTLALDRPAGFRLAMAALRNWALRADLDGFRLDLATTLGRRANGFDATAPLLAAVEQDPVLRRRVLIAEPWDVGHGGYQLGSFPPRWGEWNDRYRDTVRRFWRGDRGMLADLATRFAGSADVFGPRHRPVSRSINLITAHDGFTLADLVSYETRHNDANGEHNRDGTADNLSWNNGVEGPSCDPAVRTARLRDRRALLATLLFSRGTPMLVMGDEAGRSQQGNNNAYAQDNALSWVDWAGMDHVLAAFTARLISLRREWAPLSGERTLTGQPVDESGIPDVSWRLADGRTPSPDEWHDPAQETLVAVLYAEQQRVIVVLHAASMPVEVVLPSPRDRMRWRCALDTASPERDECVDERLTVAARSVVLLVEGATDVKRPRLGVDSQTLNRLTQEAGIASEWWDVDGNRHDVPDQTKQALLAAMHLPANSPSALGDSLDRLTRAHRRSVPHALVTPEGLPVFVALGHRPPAWLTLLREDGTIERFPVPSSNEGMIILPPQPVGRHRLKPDEHADAACHLTVAPARCYLPPVLRDGQCRFGVAAHLYTLRRDGDQGIGDFTTLARLAERSADVGAAVVGINPLHALFPGQPERASPYHPSDRRFLNPVYVDVTGMPGASAETFAALAASRDVDYTNVWSTKLRILRGAFDAIADDDQALDAFIAAGGEALRLFATFEAIAWDQGHTQWDRWPPALRHPGNAGVTDFTASHRREIRFACFLQFLADRQFAAAASAASRAGLALGFYRDLAVGMAPDGAEAWARQDLLLSGVSIGAPPDPFSPGGQLWCLPPPDPFAMQREGYAGFGDLLAANMRYAGALRVDHAMGLQRLFLVPDGAPPGDGAYLSYPFRDLIGQLALESQRARCLVVGEALGTVPEGMTQALADADVLSYSVLWFERDADGFRAPALWPRAATACVSTHDLATLAGWWEAADIAEQQRLGLIDDSQAAIAMAARQADRAELLRLLRQEGLLPVTCGANGPMTPALAEAVHVLIATTPATLALVQADDLAGERTAVNLPGTDRQRPNWRRRLAPDIASLLIAANPIWQAFRDRRM